MSVLEEEEESRDLKKEKKRKGTKKMTREKHTHTHTTAPVNRASEENQPTATRFSKRRVRSVAGLQSF